MESLDKYTSFVNKQATRLEDILKKHPEDQRAKHAYRPLIRTFREMAADLTTVATENESLRDSVDRLSTELEGARRELSARSSSLDNLEITPDDLTGLPPELIQQLSFSESDMQEFAILRIIEAAGGTISIDKLIIELWKTTQEVNERPKLNSKLYRMGQKGMIFSVPDRRGVYSIYTTGEDLDTNGSSRPREDA